MRFSPLQPVIMYSSRNRADRRHKIQTSAHHKVVGQNKEAGQREISALICALYGMNRCTRTTGLDQIRFRNARLKYALPAVCVISPM